VAKQFLLGVALLVCACDLNRTGQVRATKMGDTTHPATRGSPVAALEDACGALGKTLSNETIKRQPYLQQVTMTSAIIGWTTIAPDRQGIEVTTPEGTMVMATTAEQDMREDNATQMWTTAAGLQPDTIYCYRVMANGAPASERVGFRTAPTADSTRKIGVLVFGDSGSANDDQLALRSHMDDFPYDLIIHTGDVAYESGSMADFEATVFDIYNDLFRHIPFFPAAGNHDYKTAGALPFRSVFKLPEEEKWYSFDWGRVHFAALDTESDYATQAKWLEEDLAKSNAPWTVVFMHRPMYSSGNHGSDTKLRRLMQPIIEKHHVQLVLAGHDHDYERIKPQNGVSYVVTGGGGRGTYEVGTSTFTALSEAVIHFVYLEVGTDEMVMHAIDAEGTEFDSEVIPRQR
jgi:hypothetical protein